MTTLITFGNKNGLQTISVPQDRTCSGVITDLFNDHNEDGDKSFILWSIEIITDEGEKILV